MEENTSGPNNESKDVDVNNDLTTNETNETNEINETNDDSTNDIHEPSNSNDTDSVDVKSNENKDVDATSEPSDTTNNINTNTDTTTNDLDETNDTNDNNDLPNNDSTNDDSTNSAAELINTTNSTPEVIVSRSEMIESEPKHETKEPHISYKRIIITPLSAFIPPPPMMEHIIPPMPPPMMNIHIPTIPPMANIISDIVNSLDHVNTDNEHTKSTTHTTYPRSAKKHTTNDDIKPLLNSILKRCVIYVSLIVILVSMISYVMIHLRREIRAYRTVKACISI